MSSTRYTISSFDGFLRNQKIVETLKPDLILRFGRDPISKSLQNYLENNTNVFQIKFTQNNQIRDETLTADRFFSIDNALIINDLGTKSIKDWIKYWKKLEIFRYRKERLMYPTYPFLMGMYFI